MKEEVYKTFEKVKLYADIEISNFGDICAISRSNRPCVISANRKGKHFLRIWKENHWENFIVELELCKLFPEERLNYTSDFLYRTKARNPEIKSIKKDYLDGNSVEKISKAYKICEEAILKIISEPEPEKITVVLIEP